MPEWCCIGSRDNGSAQKIPCSRLEGRKERTVRLIFGEHLPPAQHFSRSVGEDRRFCSQRCKQGEKKGLCDESVLSLLLVHHGNKAEKKLKFQTDTPIYSCSLWPICGQPLAQISTTMNIPE
jgi:hypothetical protein